MGDHPTVTASTMIARFCWGHKVRCHKEDVENFLTPSGSLAGAALRRQEECVVVVSLGTRGSLRGLLKQNLGFFLLSGLRVGMSQQPFGTLKVVIRISRNRALEIGNRRREIPQFDLSDAAAVEGIDGISSRRDRPIVASACPGKVAVVKIEQAEFFVVARRRIIENGPLQFMNPPPPRKRLKRPPQKPGIGNHFDDDINQCPDPSQKQNDKNPVSIRPAADEVNNRHRLQKKSPSAEKKEKRSHGQPNMTAQNTTGFRLRLPGFGEC